MRLPQSWHDAALNDDEPFATAFPARCAARRRVEDESAWLARVAGELEKNDALDAAHVWLQTAFTPNRELEPGKVAKRKFSSGSVDDRKLFVEFFWGVYKLRRAGDTGDACRVLLDGIRKGEGYGYSLDDGKAESTLRRCVKKVGKRKLGVRGDVDGTRPATRKRKVAAEREPSDQGSRNESPDLPLADLARRITSSADPLDVIGTSSQHRRDNGQDTGTPQHVSSSTRKDKMSKLAHVPRDGSQKRDKKAIKKRTDLPQHAQKRQRTDNGSLAINNTLITAPPARAHANEDAMSLSASTKDASGDFLFGWQPLTRSQRRELNGSASASASARPPPIHVNRRAPEAKQRRIDDEMKTVKKPRLAQVEQEKRPLEKGQKVKAKAPKLKEKEREKEKEKEKSRKAKKHQESPQPPADAPAAAEDPPERAEPHASSQRYQHDVRMADATDSSTPPVKKSTRKRPHNEVSAPPPVPTNTPAATEKTTRVTIKRPRKLKKPKSPPPPPPPAEYTHEETAQETIDRGLQDIGAQGLEYHLHCPPPPEMLQWDEEDVDEKTYIEEHVDVEHEVPVPAPVQDRPVEVAESTVVEGGMVVDGALTLPVPVLGETQAPPLPPPPPVKPKLPVRPPIWAQSRQEVCESLDSFRSYQGGVYSAQDVARGYLLSAFAASRDIFAHGGRLIISHGGGKAEALHSKSGQLHRQRAANQLADDKSVRALLKNHQIGEPLVLLADDRYALFPYDLATPGYTYVVLGRYRIVHAWAEYQPNGAEAARVIRYKFAFEWCAEQGAPWWCPEEPQLCPQSPATLLEPPVPDVARSQCAICSKTSPLVYEQGWMCLHPECAAFWSIDGAEPASDSLTYDPAFIYARNQDAERDPALDVEKPEAPDPRGGSVTSRQFTRGIHCRVCGRLSCRWRWDGWECSSCGIRHEALGVIRSHKDFWAQQTQLGIYHHKVAPGSGILVGRTMTRYNRDGSQQASYQTFTFPEGRGKIHHIQGSQLVNKEANEIFKEYQEQAKNGQLLFRRFPLRNHKCRGELLTNYFSQNTGAPYQYVGGADRTEPLETGPPAVLRALRLVGRRVKQLLGLDAHFNEVLSAAYMEQQRMAFHSDAERGLGEVVAGLSLGSTALMHFRLHSQFVPHNDKKTNRNTVLTVALRHGDILVMEGHDVQKYYEHTVVPVNFRIAATARSISPENYQSH